MKYDQYLDIYHDQNIDRNNKYFKNEKIILSLNGVRYIIIYIG